MSVGVCGTMMGSLIWISVTMRIGTVLVWSVYIMSGGVAKGGALIVGTLDMGFIGLMSGGFVCHFLDLKEDSRLSPVKFFQIFFLPLVDCKDGGSLS